MATNLQSILKEKSEEQQPHGILSLKHSFTDLCLF